MRVLWFANSSMRPKGGGHGYNGTGWIASLQQELAKRDDVELAIAGLYDGEAEKLCDNEVVYYLVPRMKKTLSEKIQSGLCPSSIKFERHKRWPYYIEHFLRVIEDFRPDVIEVFGTEFYYGLVAAHTDVPVVVHIQGILNPILDAYFPPGVSLLSYSLQSLNPKKIWHYYQMYSEWQRECYREREIFKHVRHFIGRTEWDKTCSRIYAPNSTYHYGSEMLRSCFYKPDRRTIPEKATIVTTISQPMYKGYDVVLKTASMLKHQIGLDFKWQVYGTIDPQFIERAVGINHNDVNVELCGVATAEQLRDVLLNCTCYFHSSYIDNSPNSVCEAQMMGVPVVATNVGGESSLIEHGKTGYLVPANDAHTAAWWLKTLIGDNELSKRIGAAARLVAMQRHDIGNIVDGLITVYHQIRTK